MTQTFDRSARSRRFLELTVTLVALCAIAAAGVALFAPEIAHAMVATAHQSPALPLMALVFPVIPMTEKDLRAAATPRGLEAIPDAIFDTQLFTSASTTQLTFFNTQQNDLTLSNLNGSGTLPGGNWFRAYAIGLDVLADNTTAGAATDVGIVDDIQKLILVGRGVLNFTLNGKPIWPALPISFLHTSGGAVGGGYGLAAAADSVQYGNNSIPDGGFPLSGSIIIAPTVQFSAQITWTATSTLRSGNTRLRLWLAGTRHRPIA